MSETRKVIYLGSTLKELKKLPPAVKEVFAHGIHLATIGSAHVDSKPLKGFGGRSVVEIIGNGRGETYRAIYTVKYQECIYVLHVFKKKSTKGISMPKKEQKVLEERIKTASAHYKKTYGKK